MQHKKYRQKYRQFIAEGDKTVPELLQEQGVQISEVFAVPEWMEANSVLIRRFPAMRFTMVTSSELSALSLLSTPNEVLAVCTIPEPQPDPDLRGRVSLFLEAIRDPGNLGTLIRIADWFGMEYLVCSPDCVDAYNPKTVQATMGSIGRVKVIEEDLEEMLRRYPAVPSYAATLHGSDITGFDRIAEGFIVVGNESQGLSERLTARCTHRVTIPRKGRAESLNAAVAAGIICGRLLL